MTDYIKIDRILSQVDEEELNHNELLGMDISDLICQFELTKNDASLLQLVLQDVQPEFDVYRLPDTHAQVFLETVQESVHMSHEGWSDLEKIIIRAFLSDITNATYLTIKDRPV